MKQEQISPQNKLTRKFYTRNVHTVAKELLGKIFVRKIADGILAGKIVELEAYDGKIDEAAHTFHGKTKRNEVMYKGGGLLYVYFTYGMHFCCNVVTGKKEEGRAILIRALEPIEGIMKMSSNRFGKEECTYKELMNLTTGPAKICEAFDIKREQNGIDLCGDEIFILDAPKIIKSSITASTRIGIKKSVNLPWRYYIKNNPYISRK